MGAPKYGTLVSSSSRLILGIPAHTKKKQGEPNVVNTTSQGLKITPSGMLQSYDTKRGKIVISRPAQNIPKNNGWVKQAIILLGLYRKCIDVIVY